MRDGGERQRAEQHADEQHHARGLGADGKERGGRRGRALINVRRPDLQGEGGDLESESAHDQQHAQLEERLMLNRRTARREFAKAHRARRAVDQRDAIDEERRGHRAEDEILDSRLKRDEAIPLEAR